MSFILALAAVATCTSQLILVSTFAGNLAKGNKDGPGLKASFFVPYGVTLHMNHMYIPDQDNNLIRKYDLMTKNVTTLKLSGTPL